MNFEQEFIRLIKQEFKDLTDILMWQDDAGNYHVFDHYLIVPQNQRFQVICGATEVGFFTSSKSALSWCIADKHKLYNLAREILIVDTKIGLLNQDIRVRAGIGDRSSKPDFRENIQTKLESKIIQKKLMEQTLDKCINFAKYYIQRGLNNETARISRNQANKTSRKGI